MENAVLLCLLAVAVAVCVSVSSLDGSALFCFVVSFRTGLKRGGENKLLPVDLLGRLRVCTVSVNPLAHVSAVNNYFAPLHINSLRPNIR